MKKLIYEDSSGYCHIVSSGEGFKQEWEREEEALARLHNAAIPKSLDFLACEEDQIPKDRTFRDAWKKGDANEPVKVDFDKALSIHRTRLEQACARKIAKLNGEHEIARENQDLPAQVAIDRTKKILRKLHEMNLTHCKTVDDIKKAIPREILDVWDYYAPEPAK